MAMNKSLLGAAFLLLPLVSMQGHATDVYECLDASGERSYQQLPCPKGSTTISVKETANKSSGTSAIDITATLYSIPDCRACEEVRDYLLYRGVDVVEFDVSEDVELQNELRELSGKLNVPVAVIGAEMITGYDRDKLASALTTAGFVDPKASKE
ncbi:MAG: DUF4124 domain-containing protein [Gammaproteobacteria bacterium]|nr:glutaredoxin family protein [Gammaproteobacteria bacterium]NIR26818.1 glutaredoxin family protein [Gammaproteobacteria bacterium]NIV27093.1 DUF4124 domain-containing protein [Gammaproteobacteria bacterium]